MLATVAFRIEGQFLWFPLHLHYHFLSNCGLNIVTSIYSWLENLWQFLYNENLQLEKIFSNQFL